MPYFIFQQNPLDGIQDYEAPACVVAVKAEDHVSANMRAARELHITFDGRRWRRADRLVNEPIYDLDSWMKKYGFRADTRDYASGMLEIMILD